MAKIHIETCPVCGGGNFMPFLTCKDNLVSSEDFSILLCRDCQFGFTQDFPDDSVIGRYYEAPEYVSHSDTQEGIINTLYHTARKIALRSKIKLIKKESGRTNGSLLDIGSGTGYFLNQTKENGWDVEGVEKSESAREYAKQKFGLNVRNAESLSDIQNGTKDVVTLWHVLEHLEHLNETMQRIYSILKEDGTAIIALPNKKSVDAKHYKEDWAAYDVPRHLWHFSPSDFKKLAERNNFILTSVKPMYFDVFYISMLSEKNRNSAMASLFGLFKGGIFFLRSLFNVDKNSSVIYILKKK